jgi:cytochrome c556
MNLRTPTLLVSALLVASAVGCSIRAKPEKTTKAIMEQGFKGKESLAARISQGQGSDADHLQMVELTRQLALNRPEKGNRASWRAKTDALYAAAVNLSARQPGAVDAWKTAVNCKACHSEHKAD